MEVISKTKFEGVVFFRALTVLFILMPLSFVAAAAEDEGTSGDGVVTHFLASTFYVLRLPTHGIFWNSWLWENSSVYFTGLVINLVFWAIVVERLFFFAKVLRRKITRID